LEECEQSPAALTARIARRFPFVHNGIDAVHVQHPGKSQATWTGSDNGDGHRYFLLDGIEAHISR
jgi:hypothetical protein